MNTHDLKRILDNHAKWLKDPSEGERANLRGADLRGANLRGANLRGANLLGANLRGADLRSANLRGADLRYADLRSADLRHADLRHADLRHANLHGADLRSANLHGADLRYADLRSAVGNGREIKSLQVLKYHICYTAHILSIGCQQHSIEDWISRGCEIACDERALWAQHGQYILDFIVRFPATPTGKEKS